jgi:hypothetical protein
MYRRYLKMCSGPRVGRTSHYILQGKGALDGQGLRDTTRALQRSTITVDVACHAPTACCTANIAIATQQHV